MIHACAKGGGGARGWLGRVQLLEVKWTQPEQSTEVMATVRQQPNSRKSGQWPPCLSSRRLKSNQCAFSQWTGLMAVSLTTEEVKPLHYYLSIWRFMGSRKTK